MNQRSGGADGSRSRASCTAARRRVTDRALRGRSRVHALPESCEREGAADSPPPRVGKHGYGRQQNRRARVEGGRHPDCRVVAECDVQAPALRPVETEIEISQPCRSRRSSNQPHAPATSSQASSAPLRYDGLDARARLCVRRIEIEGTQRCAHLARGALRLATFRRQQCRVVDSTSPLGTSHVAGTFRSRNHAINLPTSARPIRRSEPLSTAFSLFENTPVRTA